VRRIAVWVTALAALFAFRLLFGLSNEFFFEDETQIFLMGLRYYTTGAWPYFGPDVVWTKSEIPGALQSLLVGVPFRIAAVPEAPFVCLNLISMAALAGFAWYLTRRLPSLPGWLVGLWLMTLPWTLEFSTHVINPSYVLAPALVFFVGFFEAVPVFRRGVMPPAVAFFMMGAAVSWVMQVHMSWPLLLPYAAFALLSRWTDGAGSAVRNSAALVCGLLLFGVFLLPTVVKYGWEAGGGGTARNIHPHLVSPWMAVTTLARFFSFASFEIARFIAPDSGKRLVLFLRHLWLAPVALGVWILGVWQPLWMVREWCRSASPFAEWRALKWLVVVTIAMVYASYWFVIEPPQAHAFYVVAPIALTFAAYCWTFIDSSWWRRFAAAALAANIAFHAGLALAQAPEKSLYRNRAPVEAAVRLKQPEMFGHRRSFAIDGGPLLLHDPSRPYDNRHDVEFSAVKHRVGPYGVVLWTFRLTNRNQRVAYRDVLHQTTYRDESGRIVDQRYDYIKDIFQPGAAADIEINDGIVRAHFASATIVMAGAEALLPAVGDSSDKAAVFTVPPRQNP
jgi:hypothetical protein